jgi:ribosomal protein L40E
MMNGKPHVTFRQFYDPDGVAEIGRAAQRNADFTIAKEQGAISGVTDSQSMTCPKCNDTNPADAKFCNNCGSRFSFICAKCNKVNPQEASFCGACGSPLT